MWPQLLAALGMAVTKSKADADREDRQRTLGAATTRLSPWTKRGPTEIDEADPVGNLMQAGGTAMAMNAGYQNSRVNQAIADRMNLGGNVRNDGQNTNLIVPDEAPGQSSIAYRKKFLGTPW